MHLSLSACPNCETALQADFRYCPGCSQTTHLHRFSIGHIAHEAVHAVAHVDNTVLGLARDLALRPGVVAYEYIVLGKRKKYFSPFVFLLLVLGLELIVYSTVKPFTKNMAPPTAQALSKMKPAEQKRALAVYKLQSEGMQSTEQNSKLLSLLTIPVLAFIGWLFFRKRGVNYAEHIVINVFVMSITSVWSILLILATSSLTNGLLIMSIISFCVIITYLALCYYQFFQKNQPITWLRAISVSTLTYLAVIVLQSLIGGIYAFVKGFQGA